MTRDYLITWLIRGIPEAFIYMYSVHRLTHTNWNKKSFWHSVVIISVLMVLVRTLPLSYGIHTLVLAMGILFFSTNFCGIDLIMGTRCVLGSLLIGLLCEGWNIAFLKSIFNNKLSTLMEDPVARGILGMPSLIGMVLILCVIAKIKYKVRRLDGSYTKTL